MNPTHVLKHNDGRMLAVQWPDEPEFCALYKEHGKCNGDCDRLHNEYRKSCEQAIANGIPFKDQNDIQKIEWLLYNSKHSTGSEFWKMEPMKPYLLPSGIELEIKYFYRTNHWAEIPKEIFDSYSSEDRKRKYAFIKKQVLKPIIIGVGMDDDKESQDELWISFYETCADGSGAIDYDKAKLEFRISRIR